MKPIRNLPLALLLLGGCVAWLSPVDALAQELTDEQAAILVIEATAPTPAADLPSAGNFYSAQHLPGGDDAWPPLPGNLGLDAWLLGSNVFLLNDLAVDYAAAAPLRSGSLSARAGGMQLLSLDPGDPGEGDTNTYAGGGGGPLAVTPFDTNGLWLEITNYATVYSDYNLHHATNQGGLYGGVYAIWTTTNLTTTWNLELELFPTDTNRQPFGLANQGRPMLFVRAQDFTAVDSNSDGVPDWWSWYFYGDFSGNATSLDSQGHTLLYDYTNHLDPNVIAFSIAATNEYVNSAGLNVPLAVTAGNPGYYAVLVSGGTMTNWLPYTTAAPYVYLGATDGVYNVAVGLKGLPAAATQTWQSETLIKDTIAPKVIIANPAGSVVITPYLQLQGYANEQLASLSYDISNATGIATNLDAFVTDQGFDTNLFDFTTNYFQAYDVELATNVNNLTLHVADRAGNVTTTNFNVTLDYSGASNPLMQLTWPTNGMELCGDSFTLRGWVDDPSAIVSAQIVSTNGATSLLTGAVERSGVLWVENLPLNSGTNWITLWATNSAGLPNTTNLYVVQNSMNLTVTEIDGDLWVPPVNVHGTMIADASYAICVNGVKGTNYGDGTWEVDNVPISASGVASFDVSASSSGGDPDFNTNVIKDAEIVIVDHHATEIAFSTNAAYGQYTFYAHTKYYHVNSEPTSDGQWRLTGYKGTAKNYTENPEGYLGGWYQDDYLWTATNKLDHYTDSYFNDNSYPGFIDFDQEVTGVPDQDLYAFGWDPGWIYHYYANNEHRQYVNSDGTVVKIIVGAHTEMKLFTGGKAGIARQNLIQLHCTATAYGQPSTNAPTGLFGADFAPWVGVAQSTINPSQLRALKNQPVGADGNLWVALPDNASPDLNLIAQGVKHYAAWATPTKYLLTHKVVHQALTDTNWDRTTIGVGEEVTLATEPALPVGLNPDWSTTAGGVSDVVGSSQTFTAPSNHATALISFTFINFKISNLFKFNVLEPTGFDPVHTRIATTFTNASVGGYAVNHSGAKMRIDVYMQPTDVSFYNVWMEEVGLDATNVTGYFTNNPPWTTDVLSHRGITAPISTDGKHHGKADDPFQLSSDNLWAANFDTCDSDQLDQLPSGGWSAGSFTWNVPWNWWIGSSVTNHMTNAWQQIFTVDANGKVTITKFNTLTVTRDTNNVVVPSL